MIPYELTTYLVASGAFALSTVFGIRLRDHLTVPTAGALAPPVAVSALELVGPLRPFLLLGPLLALLVLMIARRPLLEVASHVVLLLGAAAVIHWTAELGAAADGPILGVSLLLVLVYSAGELSRQRLGQRAQARIGADRRMWWLLQAVLACACGLTVFVVERMGWPAFLVMAAVLALTKREFEAFGESQRAYDQTVRALDRLTRRAGQSS